jgi:hypothetical protein
MSTDHRKSRKIHFFDMAAFVHTLGNGKQKLADRDSQPTVIDRAKNRTWIYPMASL